MLRLSRNFPILIAVLSLVAALAVAPGRAIAADANFVSWIAAFRQTALQANVHAAVFDAVFAGIDEPDPDVIAAANYQPEFTDKIWEYMDNRISESIVAKGRELRQQNKAWLDQVERRFGVDRDILLAIWSMETSYGDALATGKGIRKVARSLATLGYADSTRAKFARTQLIAALKIVQNGDVTATGLTGSWAGAMGHTQFIPTSYLTWAVDFDGDGKRNIWTSVEDALASSANLLAKNGWRASKTWGYEVELADPGLARLEGGTMTLSQWRAKGIKRVRGAGYPSGGDKAVLMLPAGDDGPAFLMLRNFYVLKRYNNADKYALAVGLLADEIAGAPGLARDWPRGYVLLSEDERMEAQRALLRLGLYDGEIDGKFGPGTKKAAMAFQSSKGIAIDGYPSRTLLDFLRGN